MQRYFIFCLCCILLIFTLTGCSKSGRIVVENASKDQITELFETFTIMNGFAFRYYDRAKWLFSVLTEESEQTRIPNNYLNTTNSLRTTRITTRKVESGFSVQISQSGSMVFVDFNTFGSGYKWRNSLSKFEKELSAKGFVVYKSF